MKFYESSKLLALLFTGALTLTACGDDNEGTEPNPNPPVQPETPDKGEALNQAQQKERLDKVTMKFMQLTSAADFQAMADFMHHIDATYNDEVYQWNAVERWGRDVWNSLKKSLGTSEQREEVSGSSDYQYIYLGAIHHHYKNAEGMEVLNSLYLTHYSNRFRLKMEGLWGKLPSSITDFGYKGRFRYGRWQAGVEAAGHWIVPQYSQVEGGAFIHTAPRIVQPAFETSLYLDYRPLLFHLSQPAYQYPWRGRVLDRIWFGNHADTAQLIAC